MFGTDGCGAGTVTARPECREKQLSQLTALLSGKAALPECVVVRGVAGTGKTLCLRWLLDHHSVPHAFLDCVESYQPRLLFQSALRQLGGPAGRCDTVSDFVRELGAVVGTGRAVLVLESGERLREDSALLAILTRLQEATGAQVCAVLETRLQWSQLVSPSGLPTPISLQFPQYSREELQLLLAASLSQESGQMGDLCRQYVGLVLSVFHLVTRSLVELSHIARLNLPVYLQPVKAGECGPGDTKRLWFHIEPHLRKCLSTVHLREVASKQLLCLEQAEQAGREGETAAPALAPGPAINNVSRITVELPFYSKFLLISAFLASYNPAKSDKRFFVKHHGKQRKTAASMKSKEQYNSQLTGPRPFPLERLLAIFYNVVEEQVNPTANIYSQVTSLVRLQLLTAVGQDMMDQPKYKCNVSLDFVRTVAKTVQFDVYKYLYDHC